jgi:hypothetical protein
MAEINLIKLSQSSGGPSLVDVNFNGTLEGQADTTIPIEVNLTDGVNPVTPTSVALTGNDLDIVIPPVVSPSGVLFKTIEPTQYTSYRTGDEGWRVQNGFYDYTPPSNPAAIAELDYTSANFFFILKNPLVVNGVSSTTRFVDVNGIQAFSATGNADKVFIDKLTGMMYYRDAENGAAWNTQIDNALSRSIVINSVTYDDWFMWSFYELLSIYNNQYLSNIFTDINTSVIIQNAVSSTLLNTSTTLFNTSTSSIVYNNSANNYTASDKANSRQTFFIRNARNLITAP